MVINYVQKDILVTCLQQPYSWR